MILFLQLLVAFALGALLMYGFTRVRGGENAEIQQLKRQLEAKTQDLEAYKSDVQEHFLGTAEAVDTLTKSYRGVFEELERGANRLVVSNFGGTATAAGIITDRDITGLAPAAINYAATGGSFTAAGGGILVRGSDTGDDQLSVRSTLLGSTTRVEGNGGNDTFTVTSDSPQPARPPQTSPTARTYSGSARPSPRTRPGRAPSAAARAMLRRRSARPRPRTSPPAATARSSANDSSSRVSADRSTEVRLEPTSPRASVRVPTWAPVPTTEATRDATPERSLPPTTPSPMRTR